MHLITTSAVLLCALLAAPAQAQTHTMRCKNDLAKTGDTKAAVLQKCGEPVHRDAHCKPPEKTAPDASRPRGPTVQVTPCEQVEEWTYNPGRGQFMTTLRFESGRLVSLSYGERVQ